MYRYTSVHYAARDGGNKNYICIVLIKLWLKQKKKTSAGPVFVMTLGLYSTVKKV